ncbi:ATP-grasp fold amidoligase family protein [Alcaligenes faecalis]|uniref:ATP-grasp fold amidoligase family protein n=1 Tax=Alcaligenes faecalis TaxID=511 RepID=UPI00293224EE|nr:ATP-grasp fold amidoligase family protein [Alcaligenes faecalis]MDV2116476.1 hypothetical protein [Alcaligenes faecalis]
MVDVTNIEEITDCNSSVELKLEKKKKTALKALYQRWEKHPYVETRGKYIPSGPVVFDLRKNKKYPNYLYRNINYLRFNTIEDKIISECIKDANLCAGQSLISIDQDSLKNQDKIENGVFLINNGNKLILSSNKFITDFKKNENEKYIKRLIWRYHNDFINKKFTQEDLIQNGEKLKYFEKSTRTHELIQVSGNKIQTYLFCEKNKISTPAMYYIRTGDDILLDTPNWIEKKHGFVIKGGEGCSAQHVYVFKRDGEKYYDLMHGKEYDRASILSLLASLPSVIVEQRLGEESGVIPIDIKVYCMNARPKYILLINRNHKREYRSVFIKGFDVTKREFEDNPMKDSRLVLLPCPNKDIAKELEDALKNAGIDNILNFCSDLLKKLNYKDFVSLDVFNMNNKIYLGEFTKTPGAFMQHIFKEKTINNIFS